MRELARFQQAFGRALLQAPDTTPALHGDPLELALRVHRNTTMKGLVDALAANYPTVAQLVGEEWFKGCALEFARANRARSPVLAEYGATFPSFLASFPPANELPYLADVARIDRMWIEAQFAQDAMALSSTRWAHLSADDLGRKRPIFHPAARFAWVRHSAASIWIHHRAAGSDSELTIADSEEGILLTRPALQIEHRIISRSAHQFLDCVTRGESLGTAAEAVLQMDADADIASLLATMLAAGTFAHLEDTAS